MSNFKLNVDPSHSKVSLAYKKDQKGIVVPPFPLKREDTKLKKVSTYQSIVALCLLTKTQL
jgi:hypothetical protein